MLPLVLMSLRRSRCAPPVWAVLFALVFARAAAGEVAGTLPEDRLPALKEILQTALKQSPQSIARQIQISQSEARVYQWDAQRLPSLGGHIDYVRNQTAVSSNTSTQQQDSGIFGAMALVQPLYHWGALKHQSEIARLDVTIAEKNYAENYGTVALALRRGYLQLIARKAYSRQLREALKLMRTARAASKEDLAQGKIAATTDAARQFELDEAEVQLDRYEAESTDMRHELARLAGLGDLAEDSIPMEIPQPTYSPGATADLVAGLVHDGGMSTFQAQIHKLQVDEAELRYQIATARLKPKFNASAAYSLENNTTATPNSVSQQGVARETLSVYAQWSVFDGFATKGVKLEALADKRFHERELKTAIDETLDRARSLQRQVGFAAHDMELSERSRKVAEEEIVHVKAEVDAGRLPKNATDRALVNFYVSDRNNAAARAMFFTRWSELVSLVGADPVLNNLPAAHYAREKR